MRKILITGILISLSFCFSVNAVALTYTEISTKIDNIQANVPTGTPNAPSGMDQKGFVGEMLANLFDGNNKIKGFFIQAFQSIWNTQANTLPRWNGQSFTAGTIRDNGTNIGIGTGILNNRRVNIAGDVNFTGDLYKNGVLYTPTLPTDIVRTTGDQTVGGVKTFTSNIVAGNRTIYFGDTQYLYGDKSQLTYRANHTSASQITLIDKNNIQYGRIYGAGTGTEFGLLDGDGNWSYRALKDISTQFRINNSTVMTLSGANVGIGTSNPRGRLHINTTTDASLTSVGHALTLGNIGEGNLIFDNNEILARNNGVSTTLYIQGSSSTGNTILNSDGGNVGIGTGNPTQKLDVNGKIRMRAATVAADTADTVATKGYVDTLASNSNIPVSNNFTGMSLTDSWDGAEGYWKESTTCNLGDIKMAQDMNGEVTRVGICVCGERGATKATQKKGWFCITG